jgi:hypothetical protein
MGMDRLPWHFMARDPDRRTSLCGAEMSALSIRIGRGAARLPADVALSLIPSLPRPVLERLAQRIIDHLDDLDPDPDVEANGDESDYTGSEDDCCPMWASGTDMDAGCPFADAGEASNRTRLAPTLDGEDQSFVIVPAPKGIEPTRYRVS